MYRIIEQQQEEGKTLGVKEAAVSAVGSEKRQLRAACKK
jgi:hypothetical protein